ncbi:ABC-type cobalt transport system, ATPase component [Thermosipho africanus TCF52B]|uniref:ABC-type cobalt transport system, ATPase component n=1 Tax=Thermosipho africanus (strain TCF52B) TaxID=484019 RepID=B7IF35_THEAB|nr:ABC transporter ATP-binding protein [Thermosipho africanus]ACJ74699.1 ABC-type cobalt transport system, ATPase component [Thermosipho africanus TCF52B]
MEVFYTNKKIIGPINIKFKNNELVLLLGHNGSGKTTFLKALAGVVNFKGEIISSDGKPFYMATGYVFQNPETQIVGSTVWEDVIFGLENIGLEREEIEKRALETLKTTGLLNYKDFDPYSLSGGQKQKLAISSILAMRPKFLLLDEPTAMLDKYDRMIIKRLIEQLKKTGIGIILATHHVEIFYDIADRIILMKDGLVKYDGAALEKVLREYYEEGGVKWRK